MDSRDSAKQKYQKIVDEAVYLPAVSVNFDPTKPPDWYDKDKLARSQETCMKYFYSLFVSVLIGNLLGLRGPAFVNSVLTTGHHASIAKIYRRYLSTATHMLKWFQDDPFIPESPAFKSMAQVRQMHIKLFFSLNKQINSKNGLDKFQSSLHDVIISLFPFVGLLVNYPTECGAHGITKDELSQILYAWRVIGYALGIDDKYNICDGSLEDFNHLYRQFENQYLIPLLSESPLNSPTGWRLSQGYVTALKEINMTLNFNSLILYWYSIIGVPVPTKLTTSEWVLMKVNNFVTHYALRWRYFYSLINKLVLFQLEYHQRKRDKITRNLEMRYPDITFESQCPMHRGPEHPDDLPLINEN